MTPTPILDAIYQRRSIREFTDEGVTTDALEQIISAGFWAPSGLNNQPWRFVIIESDQCRNSLAALTKYRHSIENAPVCIAVYLDTNTMYNEIKDYQAAGACIQNMLLAAEALGLGAVWLGQILANKEQVNELLELSDQYQLMAVVALGHPRHRNQQSKRHSIETFILKKI